MRSFFKTSIIKNTLINTYFFSLRQMARDFFHTLASPSTAPTSIFIFFGRSMHFLGFSRSKITKTLPGHDATSVLCPFSFQPCVGAYVARAHMHAHFGALACMRLRSPSATSYFSVCRRGGSELRVFFYSVKRHRNFFHTLASPTTAPTPIFVFFDARRIF